MAFPRDGQYEFTEEGRKTLLEKTVRAFGYCFKFRQEFNQPWVLDSKLMSVRQGTNLPEFMKVRGMEPARKPA